jgi:hypothetical protein
MALNNAVSDVQSSVSPLDVTGYIPAQCRLFYRLMYLIFVGDLYIPGGRLQLPLDAGVCPDV